MTLPPANDVFVALLVGLGIGIGLFAAKLTYQQAHPVTTDSEAVRQEALERFKLWIDFWKYFLVSFALVLITTLLGNTLKEREIGLQKAKQDSDAQIAENSNLGSFLKEAMDDSWEKQYAFASYFSHVVRDDEAKKRWNDYARFIEETHQNKSKLVEQKAEADLILAKTAASDPARPKLEADRDKVQSQLDLSNAILQPKISMRIGNIAVLDGGTLFKGGMEIDPEGSPHAYHPDPTQGLDFLSNAGRDKNWYGVVTDDGTHTGNPVIQGPSDPAPGFYVSPTALVDAKANPKDPRRYVDSEIVPYIVIPPELEETAKVKLGDLAVVLNTNNGAKLCYAVVAEFGPRGRIGEGSIALARELGVPESPKNGGVNKGVIYKIFPGSGSGWPKTPEQIKSEGERLFTQWGGTSRMLKELASIGSGQ